MRGLKGIVLFYIVTRLLRYSLGKMLIVKDVLDFFDSLYTFLVSYFAGPAAAENMLGYSLDLITTNKELVTATNLIGASVGSVFAA